MDGDSLNPSLSDSLVAWLRSRSGTSMRVEIGTYTGDPALSRNAPILSVTTTIGEIAPPTGDGALDADGALSISLAPEPGAAMLRIDPNSVANVEIEGADGSLRVYYDNGTFLAILDPARWHSPSTCTRHPAAPVPATAAPSES